MIYIKTSVDSKEELIKIIANEIGITPATNMVNEWFESYTEFTYDQKHKSVLFFKKRSAGYWETNQHILENYKVV